MPRAALFALLVASLLGGSSLQAQRAAAAFRSSSAPRSTLHSSFVGQRGFPNRFISRRSHFHQNTFGPAFFPYGEPLVEEEQSDAEENETSPPSAILQPHERISEPRAHKPLVIEVPGAASSAAAKIVPPTVFVLANGERLETRRFMLTASNLSVSIDRQQRTVPFDILDINATINANHERGIDLRIPADRNEICLSF
jgi:hypothetical protein